MIDTHKMQSNLNHYYTGIPLGTKEIPKELADILVRFLSAQDLASLQGVNSKLGPSLSSRTVSIKFPPSFQITRAPYSMLMRMNRLQHLDLSCCTEVNDETCEFVNSLTTLNQLDLEDCEQITDIGLKSLSSLTALKELNLCACPRITDIGLKCLSSFPALVYLSLNGCHTITEAGLVHLAPLTGLKVLDLRSNRDINLQKALPSLLPLTNLQNLCLDSLSDEESVQLGLFTTLRKLLIADCENLTNGGLGNLSSLIALENLDLSDSSITGEGFANLSSLTALQDLHLAEFPITEKGLAQLNYLPGLNSLTFERCPQITDKGLAQLNYLPGLNSLTFERCPQITEKGLEYFLYRSVFPPRKRGRDSEPIFIRSTRLRLNIKKCALIPNEALARLQTLFRGFVDITAG